MQSQNMNDETQAIKICLAGLQILIYGRERPEDFSYSDGNWLLAQAKCELQGASVIVSGPIVHLTEIEGWLDSLMTMGDEASGRANLNTMEAQLNIQLEMDNKGQVSIVVDITPDTLAQSHQFRFASDQTCIPPLIASLKRVLVLYPIRAEGGLR